MCPLAVSIFVKKALKGLSEGGTHGVEDEKVQRSVENLQEPHHGGDIQKPDGNAQMPLFSAVQMLVHVAGFKSRRQAEIGFKLM